MDLRLREVIAADDAPPLSRFFETRASLDQVREVLVHRSAFNLKEADPHSWAIPRLEGAVKAALVEIQADEYGGGRPERMHALLYARALEAVGLDPGYGAHLDEVPGVALATVNLMSLFGLHRRWRGALVGHLAGYEMSSPEANRRYANGLRRLGFEGAALEFFDEHVEADSVHENIAANEMAGGLARESPELAGDVLFGARALFAVDGRFARHVMDAWDDGRSSLREARRGSARATVALAS
jgi:hypothetical protein